jgi:hypothetical protein
VDSGMYSDRCWEVYSEVVAVRWIYLGAERIDIQR